MAAVSALAGEETTAGKSSERMNRDPSAASWGAEKATKKKYQLRIHELKCGKSEKCDMERKKRLLKDYKKNLQQ